MTHSERLLKRGREKWRQEEALAVEKENGCVIYHKLQIIKFSLLNKRMNCYVGFKNIKTNLSRVARTY
jgi:hypothetical protein